MTNLYFFPVTEEIGHFRTRCLEPVPRPERRMVIYSFTHGTITQMKLGTCRECKVDTYGGQAQGQALSEQGALQKGGWIPAASLSSPAPQETEHVPSGAASMKEKHSQN